MLTVKNGFSDLTKEKVGQDWQGKDVMNDCQGEALREGVMKDNMLMSAS